MKTIKQYAFFFQHRVNLKEYIETNYGLQFIKLNNRYVCTTDSNLSIGVSGQMENRWIRSDQNTDGNIINWECDKHNITRTEAVSRIIQNLENNKPTNYKTAYYKKLEIVFRQISVLFKLNKPDSVKKYLSDRGINYSDLEDVFHIGTPVLYGRLSDHFIFVKSIDDKREQILNDLYIERRPSNYRYLPFDQSVVVPVYNKSNDFVGFHGRRINPGSKSKYFSTGFLKDTGDEILYGEQVQDILDTIAEKKQVILTKGMFDFFICYQNEYKQTLATLNQGVSITQFDRLLSMPVKEIIVGFETPKERGVIIALMSTNLKNIKLLLPQTNADIDEEFKQTGKTLKEIINNAKESAGCDERSNKNAMLRRRDNNEQSLTEYGKTFLIKKDELLQEILSAKNTHAELRNFIRKKCAEGIKVLPGKVPFVRFAVTFATDPILNGFNAELRTLLFLLLKASPKTRLINYTNSRLSNDLNICENTLIKHRNQLEDIGYLLTIKVITHTNKKGRIKRKVHLNYYPSTVPYFLGD